MRKANVKGGAKELQSVIKGGLEEAVKGGTGGVAGLNVEDSYAVLKHYGEKYGIPEDVVSLITTAYGDEAEGLFEHAHELSNDGEDEVRGQALRLHLAYGWPLEALVPMVRKYGGVEADLLILTSGISAEEASLRIAQYKKDELASGFKGDYISELPEKIPGLRLENLVSRTAHPRDRPELGGHYAEHTISYERE